jgi:hypothetical protein
MHQLKGATMVELVQVWFDWPFCMAVPTRSTAPGAGNQAKPQR